MTEDEFWTRLGEAEDAGEDVDEIYSIVQKSIVEIKEKQLLDAWSLQEILNSKCPRKGMFLLEYLLALDCDDDDSTDSDSDGTLSSNRRSRRRGALDSVIEHGGRVTDECYRLLLRREGHVLEELAALFGFDHCHGHLRSLQSKRAAFTCFLAHCWD